VAFEDVSPIRESPRRRRLPTLGGAKKSRNGEFLILPGLGKNIAAHGMKFFRP